MDISFLILLFVIAFLYSSVGHGGASGYLALMALYSVSPDSMKTYAMMLNILVAGVSFINFYRIRGINWKIFIPFSVTSIPFAFWSAGLHIDPKLYKIILGFCLLLAAGRILYKPAEDERKIRKFNIPLALVLGMIIGTVSGLIGIGGGIFLSPLILIMRWATIKETAVISALFILVNSLSGIAGIGMMKVISLESSFIIWLTVVFIGGILGSYLGSNKLNMVKLRYILSMGLIFAAIKLIFV